MNKKLFVGRLPFGFSDDQLRHLFIKSGTVVSAVMVPDAKSGKTRGFGFVDMSTEAEAQAAIQAVNGYALEDKKVWVTLAREKGAAKPPEERSAFPPRSRRPFNDRSGPPMRGRPSFSNDNERSRSGPPRFGAKPGFVRGPSGGHSSHGPANVRGTSGGHFTDSAASGERRPPFRGKTSGSQFGDKPPFRGNDRPSRPSSGRPYGDRPAGPSSGGRPSFGDRGPARSEGRPGGGPPRRNGPPRDGFRGPPKRAGGRRPPPRS